MIVKLNEYKTEAHDQMRGNLYALSLGNNLITGQILIPHKYIINIQISALWDE